MTMLLKATGQATLVSIGMPIRNGERSVERALKCLRNQTYRNLELIISDNHSTDKSAAICRAHAAEDPRIFYIRQKTDIGMLKNFEFVLHRATGDYFMWAAHDDEWSPLFVEQLVRALQHSPQAMIAMCGVAFRYEEDDALSPKVFQIQNGEYSLTNPKQTQWRQALDLASGRKTNYSIYGLFDRGRLLRAEPCFPRVGQTERTLLCRLAMVAPTVWIPNVLFTKGISRSIRATAMRHQSNEVGRLLRAHFACTKLAFFLPFYIATTPGLGLCQRARGIWLGLRYARWRRLRMWGEVKDFVADLRHRVTRIVFFNQ